ncbi:MAG: SPASM domain-containing protein [Clostridia bacterium]
MNYFNALIKPSSSSCNLKCKYCFYADEAQNRKVANYGFMTDDTMKNLITKIFDEIGDVKSTVTFAFQGGEPSLIGVSFFQKFTDFVLKYNTKNHTVQYSFQTNGILIDDEFCTLFKKYDFLVGVSLDGEEIIHNQNRDNSYKKVMAAVKLLRKYDIRFNILSVITSSSAHHPKALFNFYKKNRFLFVQTIPCLSSFEILKDEPYYLKPKDYGEFLKSFFFLYKKALYNNEYISIRYFDNVILALSGKPVEQCGSMGNCTLQFVSEANGGIYPCDFYVLDNLRLGNINSNSIKELTQNKIAGEFLDASYKINDYCKKCSFLNLCKGGCKRYRDFYLSEKEYCPIEDFLTSCIDDLKEIVVNFKI